MKQASTSFKLEFIINRLKRPVRASLFSAAKYNAQIRVRFMSVSVIQNMHSTLTTTYTINWMQSTSVKWRRLAQRV